MTYATKKPLTTGWKPGNRKLTDDEVREIRASRDKQEYLAHRYGVAVSAIRKVKRRVTLAFVPDLPVCELTVEQLMYLLSKHPAKDRVNLDTLNIEIGSGPLDLADSV
jgi:hypothetical protein